MKHPIFNKIDEGTVTVADFNQLISESSPEVVRDRIRRKTNHNVTDSHLDSNGHQQLSQPQFAKRVQPKKERNPGTQFNGQGKAAHRRSTRTQRRKAKLAESKKFELCFDKAGYLNSLKDMLETRGYKNGVDYILHESNQLLEVAKDFKFDEELKDFLTNVGRAKRSDIVMPDIFE